MGRLEAPSERDNAFPMRAARRLEPKISDLVAKNYYARGPILHQGDTSTCVGHAWKAWLSGEPISTQTGPTPFEIYDGSIVRDEWEQNNADPDRVYGTSVRAGAKYLTELGHVRSYVWAFSADDVLRWVLGGYGGVVLGIRWLSDMNHPTSEGIIRSRGRRQGGHAIYCFGADRVRGLAALQNSWGAEWGGWTEKVVGVRTRVYQGCALLPLEDLDRALRQGGEACTAVEHEVFPVVASLTL
jgi:hypothetical protein